MESYLDSLLHPANIPLSVMDCALDSTPVWQMVCIISVLCYRRVVSTHKSDVSAVFQYSSSHRSACLPYAHLITTSVRNPIHTFVTSVCNGGFLLVDQVIPNCGIGAEDSVNALAF